MARKSKWSKDDRKKLLKMVKDGIAEQDIREKLGIGGKSMTAVEFAQQFKMASVDAGHIKQAKRTKAAVAPKIFVVTSKGRLTITDFTQTTGFAPGSKFSLEKPRGRSKAWRIVPVD